MNLAEDLSVQFLEESQWKPGSNELIIRKFAVINPKVNCLFKNF
jgi:hypothetical protein